MVCDFILHLSLFSLLCLCSSCIRFYVYTVIQEHVPLLHCVPDLLNMNEMNLAMVPEPGLLKRKIERLNQFQIGKNMNEP